MALQGEMECLRLEVMEGSSPDPAMLHHYYHRPRDSDASERVVEYPLLTAQGHHQAGHEHCMAGHEGSVTNSTDRIPPGQWQCPRPAACPLGLSASSMVMCASLPSPHAAFLLEDAPPFPPPPAPEPAPQAELEASLKVDVVQEEEERGTTLEQALWTSPPQRRRYEEQQQEEEDDAGRAVEALVADETLPDGQARPQGHGKAAAKADHGSAQSVWLC